MGEALLFQKFSAISSAVCLLVPRCELSAVQATVFALPLSAVWSCLASRASLLKVFHIASVSGVISRVSKKAVALERKGRKHRSEAGSGGAEGNPGAAGAAGGGKKGQKHRPLSRLLPWLQGPTEL